MEDHTAISTLRDNLRRNKGLSGILSAPEATPCSLSRGATVKCWTGNRAGVGFDSGYVRPFTEQGQVHLESSII